MTPIEKARAAVEDLVARRVRRSTAAPLLYRVLWRLGVAVPPPLFQSFPGAFLLGGIPFGVLLGASLAIADRRLAPDGAILLGTGSGVFFGALMAAYYWWYARRLGLPAWDDYVPGELTQPDEAETDW